MIDVEELRFRYPKQNHDTICGIDFKIDAGEIFGFLGPSGSGKSTTQKLLIGLLKNYSGRLQLLNKDVKDWNHNLYQHIGVGFELPNHFSKLTGLENLKLFASFYADSGDTSKLKSPAELLDLVGLADSANQRVSEYSKGMSMRLNFARALLNNPKLLFLDEPTAGLDPLTARKIKDIIKQLQSSGTTVFLTTHNMYDADELCDRVGFIIAGELKLVGAPTALKLEHGEHSVRVEISPENCEPESTHDFPLDGLGTNAEFLALINKENVRSIHSLEASLEEVFIKTTGATLQ